jgi:hypothetical protein
LDRAENEKAEETFRLVIEIVSGVFK